MENEERQTIVSHLRGRAFEEVYPRLVLSPGRVGIVWGNRINTILLTYYLLFSIKVNTIIELY